MEEKDTIELLTIIQSTALTQQAGEALAELIDRVIEENDDDDSQQHRGGIRPKHAPIVP